MNRTRRPAQCWAHIKRKRPGTWEVILRVTTIPGRSIPIRNLEFTTWQKALLYACRSTGLR